MPYRSTLKNVWQVSWVAFMFFSGIEKWCTEAYSETIEISKAKLFAKIVNAFQQQKSPP